MKRLLLILVVIQCATAQANYPPRFICRFGAGYSMPFVGKMDEQPHQLDKYTALLKPGPHFQIELGYRVKQNLGLGLHIMGSGFNLDQTQFATYINQAYPNAHVYGNGTYYSSDYLGGAPKSRSFMAHAQYTFASEHLVVSPSVSMGVRYLTDPFISYLVRPDTTYLFSTYSFKKYVTWNLVGNVGLEFGFKKLPAFMLYAMYEFGFVTSSYGLTITDSNDVQSLSSYNYRHFLSAFSVGLSLCLDAELE